MVEIVESPVLYVLRDLTKAPVQELPEVGSLVLFSYLGRRDSMNALGFICQSAENANTLCIKEGIFLDPQESEDSEWLLGDVEYVVLHKPFPKERSLFSVLTAVISRLQKGI